MLKSGRTKIAASIVKRRRRAYEAQQEDGAQGTAPANQSEQLIFNRFLRGFDSTDLKGDREKLRRCFWMCANALLGLALTIAELEFSWNKNQDRTTEGTEFVKIVLAISSVVLVVQVIDFYLVDRSIKHSKLREINVFFNLTADTITLLRSSHVSKFVWLEIFVCFFHPFPFLPNDVDERIGLLVFLRLYLLVRLIHLNSCIYQKRKLISLMPNYSTVTPEFDWSLSMKTQVFLKPITSSIYLILASILIFGYCIYVCERQVQLTFTFWDGIYLAICSMLCGWPDDIYQFSGHITIDPRTYLGTILCFCATAAGLMLMSVLIGVVVNKLEPSPHQELAFKWVSLNKDIQREREYAARLIQLVWKHYKATHKKDAPQYYQTSASPTTMGEILSPSSYGSTADTQYSTRNVRKYSEFSSSSGFQHSTSEAEIENPQPASLPNLPNPIKMLKSKSPKMENGYSKLSDDHDEQDVKNPSAKISLGSLIGRGSISKKGNDDDNSSHVGEIESQESLQSVPILSDKNELSRLPYTPRPASPPNFPLHPHEIVIDPTSTSINGFQPPAAGNERQTAKRTAKEAEEEYQFMSKYLKLVWSLRKIRRSRKRQQVLIMAGLAESSESLRMTGLVGPLNNLPNTPPAIPGIGGPVPTPSSSQVSPGPISGWGNFATPITKAKDGAVEGQTATSTPEQETIRGLKEELNQMKQNQKFMQEKQDAMMKMVVEMHAALLAAKKTE